MDKAHCSCDPDDSTFSGVFDGPALPATEAEIVRASDAVWAAQNAAMPRPWRLWSPETHPHGSGLPGRCWTECDSANGRTNVAA